MTSFQNIDDINDRHQTDEKEIDNSGLKYNSDMKINGPIEEGIQMGGVNSGYGLASRDSKIDELHIAAPKIIDENPLF